MVMKTARTTRRTRPAEPRSGRPAGRLPKTTRSKPADDFRIFPMTQSMRGAVQRCERLSACQALQILNDQDPCPLRCLACHGEGSTHSRSFAKYICRMTEPDSATEMRFFDKSR